MRTISGTLHSAPLSDTVTPQMRRTCLQWRLPWPSGTRSWRPCSGASSTPPLPRLPPPRRRRLMAMKEEEEEEKKEKARLRRLGRAVMRQICCRRASKISKPARCLPAVVRTAELVLNSIPVVCNMKASRCPLLTSALTCRTYVSACAIWQQGNERYRVLQRRLEVHTRDARTPQQNGA